MKKKSIEKIIVRKMTADDMEQALAVEKSAIKGNNHYLKEVFDYYNATKGELSVALVDDKVVGIGKFTVLFDGSAWLELLRVHADYQQMGVGTAIYQRYMEQFDTYNCPSASLYTGVKNIGSSKLAYNHGFSMSNNYHSYIATPRLCDIVPFQISNSCDIKEDINHFCINHTFYLNNEKTLAGFMANGWVYQYKDTTIIMGQRFQPYKALYIAHIEGTYIKEAIEFALHMAYIQGINQVQYHLDVNKEINPIFIEEGFKEEPYIEVILTKKA